MSWGNPQSRSEKMLAQLLWPAGFAFGLASHSRLVAYNSGLLRQQKFPARVISVGNITCGGTGKTPVTIDIARRLINDGAKVAVLSRGYRRQSSQSALVVSDGRERLVACSDAGDEPYLIATALPQCVVIVGSKRVDTAKLAIENYGCDTILLDDGFQHLPIARDCDVVLLDYNDDLLNDRLLPAGRLREPIASLSRANWIVVTKVPQSPDVLRLENLRGLIAKLAPAAKVTSCRMGAEQLLPLSVGQAPLSLTELRNKRVLAFSGIARPGTFTAQLEELGAEVVEHKIFVDHHWYGKNDVELLAEQAVRLDAELIVTTQKDAVKLDLDHCTILAAKVGAGVPITVLQQEIEWLGSVPFSALNQAADFSRSTGRR